MLEGLYPELYSLKYDYTILNKFWLYFLIPHEKKLMIYYRYIDVKIPQEMINI